MNNTIYQREGYSNRKEYLQALAVDFGIDERVVFELAVILGPNEDFDGLIIELEDLAEMNEDDEWE